MKKCTQSMIFFILVLTLLLARVTQAADEVSITKDMTSVIALLGVPCGKVVSVIKKGDNDHIASCENGNRYRVFLSAEGRVVAEKQ